MPSETIQTNDPFLDLANISSYTTGSGQPILSLPIGTTIRCRAVAEGIIEDPTWGEIPGSIEKLTGTVNLIEDLGNNSRFASDIRVIFNGDGTLNAEVDTFSDDADGGYDSVVWEVVDSSSGGGPLINGVLLPNGTLRNWPNSSLLTDMRNNQLEKYDTGFDHNTILIGSLISNKTVTATEAGTSDTPTINFGNISELDTFASFSDSDFQAYIDVIGERIKDVVRDKANDPVLGPLFKSGNTIICLDPEIVLFDFRWANELGYMHTRQVLVADGGVNPDEITEFSGLFITRNNETFTKTTRFNIARDKIIEILAFTGEQLGHDKYYWYHMPAFVFENNIWRIAADRTDTMNRPDLIAPIYNSLAADPDVTVFADKVYYYGMSWYPAFFAHRKDSWDPMITAIGNAFGSKVLMMTWPYFTQSGGSFDVGQDLFAGWPSNFSGNAVYDNDHNPYTINNNISWSNVQLFPLTRGIWHYMMDTSVSNGVSMVLFPDFFISTMLDNDPPILNAETAAVMNATIGPSLGHTFGSTDDYSAWYNFYFNELLRDVMSSELSLVI